MPASLETPIALGSRRELWVDPQLIDQLGGSAGHHLCRPVPRERVLTFDRPWEGDSCGWFSLFPDGDDFKLYYRASGITLGGDQAHFNADHPEYICCARSTDGIHWERPELGLHEHDGSTRNNIVLSSGVFAGITIPVGNFSVFQDTNPAVSPKARYKALIRSKSPMGLAAFQSSDGLQWRLLTDRPILTHGAFDSQNTAFWDPEKQHYRAYWRYDTHGETTEFNWNPAGWRAIRTAISDDFLHWSDEHDLSFQAGAPEEHLYNNVIRPYPRAPHLYLGFPMRYLERDLQSSSMQSLPDRAHRAARAAALERYGAALTETLFMASRDGVHFFRWPTAFAPPGIERPGTWNYGSQAMAWSMIQTPSDLPGAPDELSFYLTENYWCGYQGSALRRYTLRLDGFAAIAADHRGGTLITRPFTFSGDRLSLNFSTTAVGEIRVELQDASGKPLPDFTLQTCQPVFGDSLDREVTWNHGTAVSKLSGQPIRMRLFLKDASLYAFQFRATIETSGVKATQPL